MTHQAPPDRFAEAIGQLAREAGESETLRAAIPRIAKEAFDLEDAYLSPKLAPADHCSFPLTAETCLVTSALPPPVQALVGAYAATAAALLRQVQGWERASHDYATVLSRLDQLKRDLDSASRSEWVAGERIRIAQDLHDRVAQTLFGIGLTADWILTHTEEAGLRPDLERLKHLAATGLRQVRDAIFSLSSAPVEPGQLRNALQTLVRELESGQINGDLLTAGDLHAIPPDLADAVYQIVREALVNVRRHSEAHSVLVSLRVESDRVIAVIQDDGKGLPTAVLETFRANGAHLGLRGMESRANRLGGQLTLAPGDECGLIVTATIPLKGAIRHG